jgi:DNA helicase II / ATP-dependent DNA helicase PcrA
MYRAYQSMLRAANAVDFGDLLLQVVALFESNEEVRLRYQRRFEHVLVDEFQDTNPVQYKFLRLIAPPPSSNVVVVGDDDQSIYRWRGAEVDNILGFPKAYSVSDSAVIKLEQNYRSDQTILAAANEVIQKNRRRMEKRLWSARPQGELLQLLAARDERQEATLVAEQIHQLRNSGRCDFDQMAVFYRTNAQSRVFEEAFRLGRVPYVLVSGRSFYDRAEVKDATSYLRLMVNPHSDADLLRVINTPARGIGDTTIERLLAYAASAGLSLFDTVNGAERIDSLNAGALKRVTSFAQLLRRLVGIGRQNLTVTASTKAMFDETKLVDSYLSEGSEEAQTRAENLSQLLSASQEYDTQRAERLGAHSDAPVVTVSVSDAQLNRAAAGVGSSKDEAQRDLFSDAAEIAATDDADVSFNFGDNVTEAERVEQFESGAALELNAPPLQSFLEQLSLVGDADGQTGEGANRVSLMTVHAAKGLEFDAVFVTGMEEEVFPHRRATVPEASEDEMAEERRLCYVAFTRARRQLTCSFAQTRAMFGELKFNPPSRFLADVPQALFNVDEMVKPLHMSTAQAVHPLIRRRVEDEGPTLDRSFDQSGDFDSVSDADAKGLKVRHSQFGDGVVTQINGSGPNAKLLVRFEQVGEKTVIARFLTPL